MNIICNPLSGIPKKVNSHTKGWSDHWAEMLNARVVNKIREGVGTKNVVYIDHGVNYDGAINLFGGVTDEIVNNLNALMLVEELVSLDHPMPKYGEQFRKRMKAKSTSTLVTDEWCDRVDESFKNVRTLQQSDLNQEGVTVGDSHATAFAGKGHMVMRKNGRTLHGSLREGLESLVPKSNIINDIRFCLGSIDVRHHLLRHQPESENFGAMMQEYIKQSRELAENRGCKVSLCYVVPVEHEGRRIPKTGWYKNTPFYGSREDRAMYAAVFNTVLKESGMPVIEPPQKWYEMDGEEYAKQFMEANGSVHISPAYYARNNWGESCTQ
jgi:hypothetical protein